ncbi:MAG: GntR family transcriptional regulator [Pseudobdellovibrio sp.]
MTYTHGQFINLFVKNVTPQESTLVKDLDTDEGLITLPFDEQAHPLTANSEIFVIIYFDERAKQLMASMNLEKHANKNIKIKEQQQVNLYILRETPLGFKCIIDGLHIGMLYKNEVFQRIECSDQITGYVTKIRPDQKIDLILRKAGHKATTDIGEKILEELKKNNGFLALTDKTDPEKIYQLFGASKKKFKMALGGLYKSRKIIITDEGIKLI